MAKIDEIKELLNSLRVGLSITVGLLVIIIGSLINKEQSGRIDFYFWIGIASVFLLSMILTIIIISIKKNTEKIRDL